MATKRYMGTSVAVAQVDTVTIGGTPAADSTFTITVTGENGDTYALTVTSGTTNVDTAAATIAAAWNASGHYLLTPITAAGVGSGGQMTLTADTAGQPFDIVSTPVAKTDGSGSPTIARAATTASKGPYDWNDADNWDDGAVPDGSDDIIVEGVTVLYGLNQDSAGAEASLTVKNAQIGQNPPNGVTAAYLKIDCPQITINQDFNPGTLSHASPVMIDTDDTASTVILVEGSGTNSTSTLPSIWLKANANDASLEVRGGIVGLGYQGETTAVNSIKISGGSLYIGDGFGFGGTSEFIISGGLVDSLADGPTTLYMTGGTYSHRTGAITTGYVDGGVLNISGASIGTLNMTAGTVNMSGSSNPIATINQRGGNITSKSAGTYTAVNVYSGTCDFTLSNDAVTITTLKVGPGGTFKYNAETVTLTNDIQLTSDTGVRTVSVA